MSISRKPYQIKAPDDFDRSKLPWARLEKIREPVIVHTPTRNELLENNAMRANVLLTSLLQTLEARESKNWVRTEVIDNAAFD